MTANNTERRLGCNRRRSLPRPVSTRRNTRWFTVLALLIAIAIVLLVPSVSQVWTSWFSAGQHQAPPVQTYESDQVPSY